MLIICCSSKPASILPAYTTNKCIKKYSYINYLVRLGENYCTCFPCTYTTTFSTLDTNKNLNFKFSQFIASDFPVTLLSREKNFSNLPSVFTKIPMSFHSKIGTFICNWTCGVGLDVYKKPKRNAGYPKSFLGQIKLMTLGLRTKDYTLLEMIQPRRFTILILIIVQNSKPSNLKSNIKWIKWKCGNNGVSYASVYFAFRNTQKV